MRVTDDIKELLGKPWVAPTGRIKTYLFNPERDTSAPSCMLRVYNNDLPRMLLAIAEYLRKGAGVKVQLEDFVSRGKKDVKWGFYMGSHPDKHKVGFLGEYEVYNHNGSHIIPVRDDMDSIMWSWVIFILKLDAGIPTIVDVSNLRPGGSTNSNGLISTGPLGINNIEEGFLMVYKWIADHVKEGDIGTLLKLLGGLGKVIMRGGTHKNGIVTTAIDYRSPYVKEYLNFPLANIGGGSKKGLRFDKGILGDDELCDLVVEKVNTESLMLEKIKDEKLYLNVCMGILLEDKASCLVTHANAGMCETPEDLVSAYVDSVKLGCLVHESWRDNVDFDSNLYLPLSEDRQIGVGWIGWANFLRMQGVSYEEFANELSIGPSDDNSTKSRRIVNSLYKAYEQAKSVADSYGLDRFSTIEPTQRCYKDYKDLEGYTTCRNIDPPFHTLQQRESNIYGQDLINHGPVETVKDISSEIHTKHWDSWQKMMDKIGGSHAMSYDLYSKVDKEWFKDFINSNLVSTYYQMYKEVDQSYLDKGMILIGEDDDNSCDIYGDFCGSCGG